jgi:hypothetical protein
MKNRSCAVLALFLAVAASPALAQESSVMPRPLPVNPSISLSAPATSPVEAQIQNDYATQLSVEQRQLLQQYPSGTTRQELAIGHALNGFMPR